MDSPKPNRRWFRFSLRTMFLAVTVFCVWLGYCMNWIKQRSEFFEALKFHDKIRCASYKVEGRWAPMGMSLLGEPAMVWVQIWEEKGTEDLPCKEVEQVAKIAIKLFPEAEVKIVTDGSWGP